jgi:hypothetical protein
VWYHLQEGFLFKARELQELFFYKNHPSSFEFLPTLALSAIFILGIEKQI